MNRRSPFIAFAALILMPSTEAFAGQLTKEQAEQYMTSVSNDVGCVKTSIPWQVNGGRPGMTSLYFTRPTGLNPENLSNKQLEGCGLIQKPTLRGRMKGGMSYETWASLVRLQLGASQPTPWLPHVYVDETAKGVIPQLHRQTSLDLNSKVAGGYTIEPCSETMCQTFAGREIGDGNGSNPGSNPVTVSAIIDAPAKLTFPQSSPVFSEPRTSYWIGYTGSYPSSDANLAQGGIVDYLYTPSGGGTYKRHSLSLFVQYAPDPIAYLEDNIQFGDKVYVSVQYVSDTSATVSFMDMTHQISDAMTMTLMDRSACPPPPNGNGICNNGDNAMWMFEDHGDVAVMDYQDPPTTANFGKIFFDSPQAVYTNGDINVPNDANCHPFSATCGVYLTQFNLVPPNPPSGFSVTPGFLNANGGSMTIPYSGPSSGFNFPP